MRFLIGYAAYDEEGNFIYESSCLEKVKEKAKIYFYEKKIQVFIYERALVDIVGD